MNQRVSPHAPSETVSAEEAARLLKVKVSTVYAYASRGLLGGSPLGPGKRARYPRTAVERLKARAAARAGHQAVASGALRWGAPVLDTAITEITPAGPSYRGRKAVDLARQGATLEEVMALLWQVEQGALEARDAVRNHLKRYCGTGDVFQRLAGVVMHLWKTDEARYVRNVGHEYLRAHQLTRSLAACAGPVFDERGPWTSVASVIGYSCLGRMPRAVELRLLNAALVLIADHELNASAFAARVTASTGAELYACILSALSTLSGPIAGGACNRGESLWRECAASSDLEGVLQARLARGELLPGFSVGAYTLGDPRAEALISLINQADLKGPEVKRMNELRKAATRCSGELPEIDFALVALARVLGFPEGTAAGLFAVGRSVGWVAHVLEQRAAGAPIRPRARYVGP